jgi:hypothetical protein
MREWLQAQLAAGLPALSGSAISGTIAVKQELINELLARWLAESAQQPASSQTATLDFSRAAHLVKHAAVRAEPGTVLVDFKVSI